MTLDFSLIPSYTTKLFDVVVSNPPYHQTFAPTNYDLPRNDNIGNVFHLFQELANTISSTTCMIYPGERWIKQTGLGMKEFGQKQLNSESLAHVIFYPDSRKIFSHNVYVAGGISIVLTSQNHKEHGFMLTKIRDTAVSAFVKSPQNRIISTEPLLNTVIDKVHNISHDFIADRMTTQRFFGFESSFVERNKDKVVPCNDDFTNFVDSDSIRILTNDKAGKMGRVKWFWISRNIVQKNSYAIDKWKVIFSLVNLTGDNGRTPNADILPPGSINGRSRVVVGIFDTETEAKNYVKYLSTVFMRALIASTGNFQKTFGMNAPDLMDYTHNSEIDFSLNVSDIHKVLLQKYSITDEENAVLHGIYDNLVVLSRKELF